MKGGGGYYSLARMSCIRTIVFRKQVVMGHEYEVTLAFFLHRPRRLVPEYEASQYLHDSQAQRLRHLHGRATFRESPPPAMRGHLWTDRPRC